MKGITVAIMSYNYGPFVSQAIDSVIGQTRRPDGVLFVDDCSKMADMGVSYAKNIYHVRTIERPMNLGIVENFDDILQNQITTSHVLFLGADNYLRPDTLEKLSKHLDNDIISYDLALVGDTANHSRMRRKYCEWDDNLGYHVRKFKNDRAIRTYNSIHGSACYNVELAKKVGGYKPMDEAHEGVRDAKRPQEDWSLWQRMIREGKATRAHVPHPLLYYRRHRANFSGIY